MHQDGELKKWDCSNGLAAQLVLSCHDETKGKKN